jgi:hypothetical protein
MKKEKEVKIKNKKIPKEKKVVEYFDVDKFAQQYYPNNKVFVSNNHNFGVKVYSTKSMFSGKTSTASQTSFKTRKIKA